MESLRYRTKCGYILILLLSVFCLPSCSQEAKIRNHFTNNEKEFDEIHALVDSLDLELNFKSIIINFRHDIIKVGVELSTGYKIHFMLNTEDYTMVGGLIEEYEPVYNHKFLKRIIDLCEELSVEKVISIDDGLFIILDSYSDISPFTDLDVGILYSQRESIRTHSVLDSLGESRYIYKALGR